MFVIEDNIPAPESRHTGKYAGLTSVLRQMSVGQSVLVPVDGDARKKNATVSGFVSGARKATGFKYLMRSVDGGMRIWRIK